jgi:hypothetical protein
VKAPRNWKKLERDPESTRRGDMPKTDFDRGADRMKRFGWIGNGRILLRVNPDTGKLVVWNGWQRKEMAVVAGIVPPFELVKAPPRGMTWEEYAEVLDDIRRHSTPEAIVRRREVVVQLRQQGESVRAIAGQIGVPKSTVQHDLSTVQQSGTVETPGGKVHSLDGRDRPATKPKILCGRCTRVAPGVGVPGCDTCKKMQPPVREPGDDTKRRKQSGKPKVDWKKFDRSFGPLVRFVDEIAEAYPAEKDGPDHKKADDLLEEFANVFIAWKERLVAANGAQSSPAPHP